MDQALHLNVVRRPSLLQSCPRPILSCDLREKVKILHIKNCSRIPLLSFSIVC